VSGSSDPVAVDGAVARASGPSDPLAVDGPVAASAEVAGAEVAGPAGDAAASSSDLTSDPDPGTAVRCGHAASRSRRGAARLARCIARC
jgi:hypothetical protein